MARKPGSKNRIVPEKSEEIPNTNDSVLNSEPEPIAPGSPAPFPVKEPGSVSGERLGFKVINGKIDTEGMRESTKARLAEVLKASTSDPNLAKQFGLVRGGDPNAPAPLLVEPMVIGQALDFIAMMEAQFFAAKYKMPFAEAYQFVMWTRSEHDGVDGRPGLDKMGAQVASKYIPPEWLQNSDWALFLMQLGGMTLAKVKALAEHVKTHYPMHQKATETQATAQEKAPETAQAAAA